MPWYFYNNRGVLKQPGIPDPLPVGLISAFVSLDSPAAVAPAGWLLCDGTVRATTLYPKLAAVLAYPSAPGGTFAVPNLNGDHVIGTSGTFPLNSTGGTSQHPHTINSHSHTNSHQHGMSVNHTHPTDHTHGAGDSAHAGGPYNIGAASGGINTYNNSGSTTYTGGNHVHALTGVTGVPDADTGASKVTSTGGSGSFASTASGAQSTPLGSTTPTISPVVDTLPPYLNVYYIIKAVDYSGTYI